MTEDSGEKQAADFVEFLRNRIGGDAKHEDPTAPGSGQLASGVPKQIGPYKILEQIGEGGMGVVYLAEQLEPVRRRVALKIIKVGMDTKAVVARFGAEQQALALMDHPCVAKVLDAGVTDTGRPYFVMEHVAGIPITEHCDRQRLGIDDRLKLFMQVCDAVQHAHQKGVIHRDLKPSNILISVKHGTSVPKVIDFGVAKALHHRLTEQTLFTEQGQLIGTPEYMSPEQAEMTAQDIDTRSDIYSLGVLLYELLTGERPFSTETLRLAGLAEIQRMIREEDPPKPSTRLSSLGDASATHARSRRADPTTLSRSLRGDLDWIVMKCLEKDRERRYDTATGVADDLRRHLDHRPVQAGPPTTRYRLEKFVRRNLTGVIAAAVVLVVLLAGMIATTWGWLEAKKQTMIASDALSEVEQVAEFQELQLSGIDVSGMGDGLRESIVREARAGMERSGLGEAEVAEQAERLLQLLEHANMTSVALDTLERNIFERALQAVDEQFADQELLRARLLQTLADTLRALNLLDKAEATQINALEIRERVLGREHADTLYSIDGVGRLHYSRSQYDKAERYFLEALEGRRRVLGNDHPDTLDSLDNMGAVRLSQERYEEAEAYLLAALDGFRRVLGEDDPKTLNELNTVGCLYDALGKPEAEPYLQQALDGYRRVRGKDHPDTLNVLNSIGLHLFNQGRLVDAKPYYRAALEGSRHRLGDDHSQTLLAISSMGIVLRHLGELEEAQPLYREALEGFVRFYGEDHLETLSHVSSMGQLAQQLGRHVEAEQHHRKALAGRQRHLPETDWHVANSRSLLGEAVASQGRYDEAEPLLLEAYAGLDAALAGERVTIRTRAIERIVHLYGVWGKEERADEWRTTLQAARSETPRAE